MPDENSPRCTELSKQGNPCKSYPVRGETKCAGHLGLGVAARTPEAEALRQDGNVKSRRSVQARAAKREQALEEARLGVRERLALRLNERAADVVRVLVDDAIERGDAATVRAAIDQGLGKPTERVEQLGGELDVMQLTHEQRMELIRTLGVQLPPLRSAA